MDSIVTLRSLRKVYDAKTPVVAIDGLDLDVRAGEIYGLLGPNGAGKTTTISICTTRVLPTAGSAIIAGIDVVKKPSQARCLIGVVPQYNTLDRACTIFENIHFHCLYFGFSRSEADARTRQLLDQFHLADKAESYPAQLSGGLAQRVQIARAIAHRPRVLFLDEPSAGLDPQSRMVMWEIVERLHEEGITVVLTTHYMEEADRLCDRLAIVDHGRILIEDTPQALKSSVGAGTVYELDLAHVDSKLEFAISGFHGVSEVQAQPRGLRILAHSADGLLPEIVAAAQPFGLQDMRITQPSLETVFIRLTGRDLRE